VSESREVIVNTGRRLWRQSTRGMRRTLVKRRGLFTYLAVIGPGMVAANAGNDAGGIATYSTTGANYGYNLLWTLLPLIVSLGMVQEMCARMGAITGKGLADLVREQFGVRWTAFVMLALFIANGGVTVSEFVGIAVATEIIGLSRYITVPIAALIIWWLVVKGSYKHVERVFLFMSLVFLGYIISAFLAEPKWREVSTGLIYPHVELNSGYLFQVVALIGTTISPYMQIFVQSSVVDKGVTEKDYDLTKLDVWVGTIFAISIAAFIIIATAATLHKAGIVIYEDENAIVAITLALEPLAGPYAKLLFAVGLLGASMLAAGVLPLSTAYSISEALGFEKGISRSFREAPIFLSIFSLLIITGAVIAMIPSFNPLKVLLITQVINGLLLPVILIAVLRLINNRELMGKHVNSPLRNIVSWIIVVIISCLSLLYIGQQIYDKIN
jgi:NRAMP (natural resistance-associated macrophage protein)-like metal ion transporter